MQERFIENHQFNFIREQVEMIRDSRKKSLPPSVLKAVIDLANAKIAFLFPEATSAQLAMLDVSKLQTDEAYDGFIDELRPHVRSFPQVSEQQVKKMFPKQKKLRLPDAAELNVNRMSYMSWNDLRSNRKYILCEKNHQLIGIELKASSNAKKNICAFCNQLAEVSYCVTITKAKQAKNPDYYKAIGTYICTDSASCNENMTNLDALMTFVETALKE
ncbi:FusB/FusC family EF-G-binding protein [Exiguobacterium sp. s70]|uniref:FusB/FusC family EF-G-binding protein n=1 Tax=Exiguobacterium sp. s70 TaxID=2751228 RepID=UPI001BEC77FB|nr:FusB/FusC family EF-G-binding protein [Exiguobacterium sp. s70]